MSNKGLSVWCNFKIEQNRAHTRETIFSANEQHHENEQDSFHPKCWDPCCLLYSFCLQCLFFMIWLLHNLTFSLAKRVCWIVQNGPVSAFEIATNSIIWKKSKIAGCLVIWLTSHQTISSCCNEGGAHFWVDIFKVAKKGIFRKYPRWPPSHVTHFLTMKSCSEWLQEQTLKVKTFYMQIFKELHGVGRGGQNGSCCTL